MRLDAKDAARLSAAVYTSIALLAALAFFLVTLLTGDYTWVARVGGAAWVFGLSMIILMPTVTPWIRSRTAVEPHDARAPQKEVAMVAMVRDPVCGMEIDPAAAAGTTEYEGEKYYFCNQDCKKSFDQDPERYIAGA